jgi:hypothetical protein
MGATVGLQEDEMSTLRLPLSILCVVLAAILSVTPASAAGKEKGSVQGKIIVAGKPLAAGKVWFHPPKGKPVGATVKNGAYSAVKVPLGGLKVTVEGKAVPKRYSSPDTTPLRTLVKEGANTIDLALD